MAVAGLTTLASGGTGITAVLFAIGGCGILGSTVHQTVVRPDSSAAVPGDRTVRFTAAMAFIAAVAAVWGAVS